MLETLRAKLRKHRNATLISLAVIAILLLLYWAAQVGGTLWEYLQVLIIPVVLGTVAWLFNRAAKKRDREIENDRQHQATLATYFDRMSELLLRHNLRNSEAGSEVRTVARAWTDSALRNLDGKRIAQVIQFLTESNLGGKKLFKIELPEADLEKVDLRGVDLQGADLRGANLQGAELRGALVLATQLPEASSLQNAIMPDGTKYEERVAKGKPDWSKEVAKQRQISLKKTTQKAKTRL